MPNSKKQQLVEKLKEQIEKSQAVFLADYTGLDAMQINTLRAKLKEVNAKMMVIKNRLFALALSQTHPQISEKLKSANIFKGPLAAIFAYQDEVTPVKTVDSFSKEQALDTPAFKAGFNPSTIYSLEDIKALIQLPDKATLQAKVVGALNAPVFGLVNSLSWPTKQLVWVLNSIKQSKEGKS